MKFSLELYTEKPFVVKEGSFFKLSIRSHGLICSETKGKDEYRFGFVALSGKSLAGVGRKFVYELGMFPSGLGCIESRPGAFLDIEENKIDDIAVIVETNLVLDLGMLIDSFGLRLINENGKAFDIPLCRPDIEIAWNARGRFVIPITRFINGPIFKAA